MKKMFFLAALLCFASSTTFAQIKSQFYGTWESSQGIGGGLTVNYKITFNSNGSGIQKRECYDISGNLFSTTNIPFTWILKKGGLVDLHYGKVTDTRNGVKTVDAENSYKTFWAHYSFEGPNVMNEINDGDGSVYRRLIRQ